MNIIEKSDEEIIALANPMWSDLIKHSNQGNYGEFVKAFSNSLTIALNEVEVGKQFAASELTRSLSDDFDFLGTIRRGEHVTVLYRQRSTKREGEWLGRLVLGLDGEDVKIFGAFHLLEVIMSDVIQNGKLVELTYKVTDKKSGEVLTAVEFPLGYVHGHNDVLAPQVHKELEGKSVGDIIEVPIDCNQLYGPRDESLVFTDRIENVPEDYREIGTTITMESDKGQPRNFIVTRMDDQTLTVDGNNPLSGREVLFVLEVLTVREATDEEIAEGGAIQPDINVEGAQKVPI